MWDAKHGARRGEARGAGGGLVRGAPARGRASRDGPTRRSRRGSRAGGCQRPAASLPFEASPPPCCAPGSQQVARWARTARRERRRRHRCRIPSQASTASGCAARAPLERGGEGTRAAGGPCEFAVHRLAPECERVRAPRWRCANTALLLVCTLSAHPFAFRRAFTKNFTTHTTTRPARPCSSHELFSPSTRVHLCMHLHARAPAR